MSTTLNRASRLITLLALAGVTAVSAQQEGPAETSHQEQEAEVTVELAPRNDSGIHGTARIYEPEPESEMEEGEAHEEEYEHEEGYEQEEQGEMHAHSVVVELHGLASGQSYPVHVHRGSCAEGGPVLLPLESVAAGSEGAGSSTTTLTASDLAAAMEKAESEGEDTEGHEHPSLFLQAHRPGGTPAACGDVPMGDDEGSGEGY